MDLDDRIATAEQDLNDALAHATDLEIARRQVVEALDDLRVYRNLLALLPFAVPSGRNPRLPIPAQTRRRVFATPKDLAQPVPQPYRGAAVGYHDRRDGSGRFARVERSQR